MAGAVFVEHGAAFVIGLPFGSAVDQGFGEDDHVAGVGYGLVHVVGGLVECSYLIRNVGDEVAFVGAGDAGKAAGTGWGWGQAGSEDGQAVANDAVVVAVPVVARDIVLRRWAAV